MTELWQPIPGQEPYEASSLGRIRNSSTGRVFKHYKAGTNKDYCYVGSSQGFRGSVHRLVALAFIGPIPDGYEVNHIDGDKSNNTPENLEIITRKENMEHAARMGFMAKPTGHQARNASLTWEQVEFIRKYGYVNSERDGNLSAIASKLGVDRGAVHQAFVGNTYSEGPWPDKEQSDDPLPINKKLQGSVIEYDGKIWPSINALARAYGVKEVTLTQRLRKGWPLERALSREDGRRRSSKLRSQ